MKYKYIKTLGDEMIWGKNEITKEDLAMVKDGRYDMLLDIENGKWYDWRNNTWKDIIGD